MLKTIATVFILVFFLAFLSYFVWEIAKSPGFFVDNPEVGGLVVLGVLAVAGLLFQRWLSPRARPRKTVAERTQNDRTLLFDKNEELQRVGFFDRILGEFVVLVAVLCLYMGKLVEGGAGWLLLAAMSGVVWFISRPPYSLRHAPDRIYGTKDALLVARRGVTENIPYSCIARHEIIARFGIVWYGHTIILHLTGPGRSGKCVRFFMTTPSRAVEESCDGFFVEPVSFEEDFDECIQLHNKRAEARKP
ncbi:MAG: hypothetical protein LBQ62_10920 [Candidatus Accumulibacter sp.]|jgi:hypothetical protein|nr:hypothetical protein [Accumulibacter sp.]